MSAESSTSVPHVGAPEVSASPLGHRHLVRANRMRSPVKEE